MYIPLIFFFASLISIVVMIVRKVVLIDGAEIIEEDYTHPFVPDIKKIKGMTVGGVKKYGHLSVITMLRLQVKSSNFLKNKYAETKEGFKKMTVKKDAKGNPKGPAQVSKFLKTVSEYKNKLKQIKREINEEEEEKNM